MIKKILLWVIYAGFVGLIVFGAINRTTAKLEDEAPARASEQSENAGGNRGQGNQASSESESTGELESTDVESYPASPDGLLTSGDLAVFEGDSEHEWVTLTGTVTSVTTKTLTLTLDNGQNLAVERRPWRFAQENGFTTSIGNQIQLTGFYELDQFQAAQITDLTTGMQVLLRDETGHPLWASE